MSATETLSPRPLRISQHQIDMKGKIYTDQFIGNPAAFDTFDGERLFGVVGTWEGDRPIIRFDNGTWAYGSRLLVFPKA